VSYGPGNFLQMSSAFPHTGLMFTQSRLMDLDGSQTIDWVSTTGVRLGHGRSEPDLLQSIADGRGGSADIQFETVVGHQGVHFPVSVVSTMTTYTDSNTVYWANYEYRDGYFDRIHRRFSGFGDVRVRRSDNLGTAERFERRIFATGNYRRNTLNPVVDEHISQQMFDDPVLTGLQLGWFAGPSEADIRCEVWTPWWPAWSSMGAGGPAGTPQLLLSREYDLSPDGRSRVRETSFSYDERGNISLIADHGEVSSRTAGGWPTEDGDDIYTVFQYAFNEQFHILSLPSVVTQCASLVGLGCSESLRERRFNYDFLGPGVLDGHVNIGDLTTMRELVRYPGEPDQWAWTNRRFDIYGNVTAISAPDGSVTTYAYQEPDYVHRSLESTTVTKGKDWTAGSYPVTLNTRTIWDAALDVVLFTVDPSGRATFKVYDEFGRPRQLWSTDEYSGASWVFLEDISYQDWLRPNFTVRTRYSSIGQALTAVAFTDGLGRPIQEKTWHDDGRIATEALLPQLVADNSNL